MKISSKIAVLSLAAGSLLSINALAQSSDAGPGVVDPNHPRINEVNQREQDQQNRIANGIKDGSLTPKEASKLENKETKLENKEKQDIAKDGGHLSKKDYKKLNAREDKLSKKIYSKKHNDATTGQATTTPAAQ